MNKQTTSLTYNALATRLGGTSDNSRKLLLAATLVTLALWYLPYSNYILYPLRLFITFIHESGHAAATLLSSGSVASLRINPDGSGVTYSYQLPWYSWLIISGGYLGTTIFGALLLQVGRLSRWKSAGRATLYTAAGLIGAVTLLWGRDLFTWEAGAFLVVALGAMARFLPRGGADFVASFLAVQCSLNALGDLCILLNLTAAGSGDNDAVFMARDYPFLPPTAWALLWAAMSLVILVISLRSYWRGTAKRGL